MTKFEHAEDYPTTVLLIIDGWCDVLRIRHEHAFPCCRASFGCRDHQPDDEPWGRFVVLVVFAAPSGAKTAAL